MALPRQLKLELDLGIRPLESLRPAESAQAPVVWVEWLEVHHDTPTGDATLLRRIGLRRGLNILWATSSDERLARLGGHGAGKTTFCRLLRFALGESTPGSRQFRERFRTTFPNGWILADVWVDGTRWLVARPLGDRGHHPWALEGATLREPLPNSPIQGSFKDYEKALESATVGRMATTELSGSGRSLRWPMLLPWLARDQEAHYASLIEWRSKDSESETDGLSAADRENLMRLVLGIVDPTEQARLRERERIAHQHERLTRERPQRDYHREQARKGFEAIYSNRIGTPGDLIFERELQAEVSKLNRESDDAFALLQEDDRLKQLVSEEAAREIELEYISTRLAEARGALNHQRGTVEATGQQASDAVQLAATTKFLPFRGFCSTLLTEARRKGCPCLTTRPDDDEVDQATREILESAGVEKTRLEELEDQVRQLAEQQGHRENALKSAREATRKRRGEVQANYTACARPRERAAALKAAYDLYVSAESHVAGLATSLEALAKRRTELDRQIEAHARGHRIAMERFSDLFNAIIQAMLGREVIGRVELAGGKSLEPRLEFHGTFDSAALNLTKLLAFDLAALAFSLFDGSGYHPRFLLHDSPRESDLAAPIYASLFLVAKAIETACGDEPGFQYIVTTTAPPPDELGAPPWLLDPVLDATSAKLRILGVDL